MRAVAQPSAGGTQRTRPISLNREGEAIGFGMLKPKAKAGLEMLDADLVARKGASRLVGLLTSQAQESAIEDGRAMENQVLIRSEAISEIQRPSFGPLRQMSLMGWSDGVFLGLSARVGLANQYSECGGQRQQRKCRQ